MTQPKKKLTLCWKTKDRDKMQRMRDYFRFPRYSSRNGEQDVIVTPEQENILQQAAHRGLIEIRNKPTP